MPACPWPWPTRFARLQASELLDALGAIGVSQTQRRISDEQQGPNGEAWAPLNPRYASSKRGSGGLLQGEGDLVTSMDHIVGASEVSWGSPLVYAAIHHFGGTITPKNGGQAGVLHRRGNYRGRFRRHSRPPLSRNQFGQCR